eukprot:SAG22_NODE_18650_length_283_cov_1.119565_1_plen_80_part_01
MEELLATSPDKLRLEYGPSKATLMKVSFFIFMFVSAGGHYCLIHGAPLFLLHPTHGFFLFHYSRRGQFILEGVIMACFTA